MKLDIKRASDYNHARGYSRGLMQRILQCCCGLVGWLPVDALPRMGEPEIRAVAKWQERQGLVADGMVGPKSLARVLQTYQVDHSAASIGHDAALLARQAAGVSNAVVDWLAGTTEADTSNTSRLAAIFRDSSWSPRVDWLDGRPREWCGMAYGSWHGRAGLLREHLPSMFGTKNARAHFSYGAEGPTNRYVHLAPDGRTRTRDWHAAEGALRLFQKHPRLDTLSALPGDMVLFGAPGKLPEHIAMVRSFDGRLLETIEGNTNGYLATGHYIGGAVAVAVKVRDLGDRAELARVYMIGRLSRLDFADRVV